MESPLQKWHCRNLIILIGNLGLKQSSKNNAALRGFDFGVIRFSTHQECSGHKYSIISAEVGFIMKLGSPIILVSAFGRDHWLAAALAQEGIKTTLIDVSPQLGVWPVEDIEGPFGFYRNEKISESQLESLYSANPFEEVPNGFTLWLPEGPIEFKGPLTKFKIEKMSLIQSVKDVFFSSFQDKSLKLLYKNISEFSFKKTWLLHFAHQFAGTTYVPSVRAAEVGQSLPLLSPFLVRRASSRAGLERSLEWLRSKGVDVIQPQQLMDVSFGNSRTVSGFEISGVKQGLFRLEQLVWALTSEETYFLSERLGKYFFPEGALESEWCWIRFRVGLSECFERESLPLHSVILGEIDSPWTHENLIVMQRTSLQNQFDMWMRIPTVQRFNKEYLTHRGERMQRHIKSKMPLSDPQILMFPQEYYYTYAQLGAPRFPVYSEKDQARRGKNHFKNVRLNSPEDWPLYSWNAIFERSEDIKSQLMKWWQEKLLKEQKEKRKEQSQ
jgi:hypothetical protein